MSQKNKRPNFLWTGERHWIGWIVPCVNKPLSCKYPLYAFPNSLANTLTINPSDANSLKNSHKEQAHPTGRIVVKKLEDVHASLWGKSWVCKRNKQKRTCMLSNNGKDWETKLSAGHWFILCLKGMLKSVLNTENVLLKREYSVQTIK